MKKLLIIADFIYPHYIGGSSREVYDFILWLYKKNIDFTLITRSPNSIYKINETDNIINKLIKQKKIIVINKSLSGIIKLLFTVLKFIKYKGSINIHYPILALIFVILLRKAKIIYHFHGPFAEEYNIKTGKKGFLFWLRYKIEKYIIKRSNTLITHSLYMSNKLSTINKESNNIIIIAPSVDINKFKIHHNKNALRSKLNLPTDKIILFTSRRLTNRTGVLELIKNFNTINEKLGKKLFLIVSGKGELEKKIKNISNSNSNILFLSYIQEKTFPLYYQSSNIYILPSLDLEGFGLVILEAFACGIPVIVSNKSGGGTEFIKTIDEKLIFQVENFSQSISEAIKYSMQKYTNNSLYFRKIAEKFKPDAIFSKYYNILIK